MSSLAISARRKAGLGWSLQMGKGVFYGSSKVTRQDVNLIILRSSGAKHFAMRHVLIVNGVKPSEWHRGWSAVLFKVTAFGSSPPPSIMDSK